MTINPKETSTKDLHGLLLGGIGPRPIALASTIDKDGNANLSPFSFFNIFSANPPIVIISPARRVRDNTIKHTLENAYEHPEMVINIVNHSMVEQTSLSSTEYEKGVDEFTKSGFTAIESDIVKPFRVKESPMQLECKIIDIKEMGDQGGAGNLIFGEIVRVHVDESVLDENNKVNPFKIDLVGRMGGNWYCRANDDALFEVEKPLQTKGIGYDKLPTEVKESGFLTGNDLGKLANVENIPSQEEVENWKKNNDICQPQTLEEKHLLAKELLEGGNTQEAWYTLMLK
jgi:flavin reductase (DIM6/NTAB) family NADH-FMN oxidoreductase RutF